MRQVTEEGLNLIKRFEGFSPTIYICPAGYPTIGYGHVVPANEQDPFAAGITQAEATELLRKDVRIAERAVLRLISVPLTDGQFDALVSFTFNLGAGALQRSTLRRKVNDGDHESVSAEFMKWVWASGKRLPGLLSRRRLEGQRYSGSFKEPLKYSSPRRKRPKEVQSPGSSSLNFLALHSLRSDSGVRRNDE